MLTQPPAPATTRYVRVDGYLKPITELSEPIITSKAPTTPLSRATLAQEAGSALGGLLGGQVTSDALAAFLSTICDALPDGPDRGAQRDARDAAIRQHRELGPAIRRAVRKLGSIRRAEVEAAEADLAAEFSTTPAPKEVADAD